MKNYVKYIRSMVGKKRILVTFVLAAIFNQDGELLLQKRGGTAKWGLPGGSLELGETFEEALVREVKEETGFKVKPVSIIGIYTGSKYYTTYSNGDKTQPVAILFNCKVIGGKLSTVIDEETLELKYFKKGRLPEIWGTAFKDMVTDAFAKKKSIWR